MRNVRHAADNIELVIHAVDEINVRPPPLRTSSRFVSFAVRRKRVKLDLPARDKLPLPRSFPRRARRLIGHDQEFAKQISSDGEDIGAQIKLTWQCSV